MTQMRNPTEIKIIKRNQREILALKSSINDKNIIESLNSIIEQAEEICNNF